MVTYAQSYPTIYRRIADIPRPQPRPLIGWFPERTDIPLMVNHVGYFGKLKYSNETIVALEYRPDTGEVVPGKLITPLHKQIDRRWIYRIEFMNSYSLLEKFVQPGWGFCDTDAKDTNPYTDEVKLGAIDCGGNRRCGKKIISYKGKNYILIDYQEFNSYPDQSINYYSHPHLVEKQVDYGDFNGRPFWRTAGGGDVWWPWLSRAPLVHALDNVTLYPQFNPDTGTFECLLYDYTVSIGDYCFTGSDTWVNVVGGELDSGWYQADGMYVPPDRKEPEPGNDRDYFCNIKGVTWPKITPPMAGWQKV